MFFLFNLSCILFFILLLLSSCKVEKHAKIAIELISIVMVMLIASSRVFFQTDSDDMIRYYESYVMASQLDYLDYIGFYRREIFFESFNWLIANFSSGSLNVNQYTFILISPTVLFGYVFFKRVAPDNNISVAFLCMLMPGLLLVETQLVRQAMSFFVFLYAMSVNRIRYKYMFLLISIMIHLTSFIYIIFWILGTKFLIPFFKVTKGKFTFLCICICFGIGIGSNVYYLEIINFFAGLPFVDYKISYLLSANFETFSIGKLYLIFCLLLSFVSHVIFLHDDSFLKRAFKLNPDLNQLQINYIVFNYVLLCFILVFIGIQQLVERFSVLNFTSMPIFLAYSISFFKVKNFNMVRLYPVYVIIFFVYYIYMVFQPSDFSLFDGYFIS
ncbi:EpsG family protein [Vibrio cholerae]|uniref:EpsG family protein n=1 Tax=Vibrio cholerae TaxID=666 RepID=UPI0029C55FC2|nr:EpsG family protein [Vibrio cholerae]MDX5009868.1 EpsG family protein [Vibrio cholerae]